MIHRRRFLRNCSALAVTGAMAPLAAVGASFAQREVPLEHVSLAAFTAQWSSLFLAHDGAGHGLELRLIEVQRCSVVHPGRRAVPDGQHEKFSLLFRGPLAPRLEQNTWWFDHPRIGRFTMFIVPVGRPDTASSYYEAIFNRAMTPGAHWNAGSVGTKAGVDPSRAVSAEP